MKLVTFIYDQNAPRIGVLNNNEVVDLQAASEVHHGTSDAAFKDMLSFISEMPNILERTNVLIEIVKNRGPEEIIIPLKKLQLLAPLPRPSSIRDFVAFEDHLVNSMHTIAGWYFPPVKWINGIWKSLTGKSILKPPKLWYKIPAYYKGNPLTVIGPDIDIQWPSYAVKLDYELEFGIYISRQGRDIPVNKAGEYIAGYTIFNDVSARMMQLKEMKLRMGPTKGKDFDTSNIMGPYLVTPDELPNPYNLEMVARINGIEWSKGNSRQMHYSFEEIISYVSRNETLYSGEFFGSGTVPTGCGLELNRWIHPGDVIELEVERLGVLRNSVVKM